MNLILFTRRKRKRKSDVRRRDDQYWNTSNVAKETNGEMEYERERCRKRKENGYALRNMREWRRERGGK